MRFSRRGAVPIVITAVLVGGITLGGGYLWLKNVNEKQYNALEEKNSQLLLELEQSQYSAVTALSDIKKGTLITEDMVISTFVSYGGNALSLVESKDIAVGSIARSDILANDIITYYMINEYDPANLREKEAAFIRLQSNMVEDDAIDIRIVYPNGEDYIVVAKKHLKDLDLINNNTFVWLTEEEILLLDSAVVDASIHEGAYIYCVKYLDSEIQESSIVNYLPNEDVLNLIKKNPNIVEAATAKLTKETREALEKRLEIFESINGTYDSIDVKNPNVLVAAPTPTPAPVQDPVVPYQDPVNQQMDLESSFQER